MRVFFRQFGQGIFRKTPLMYYNLQETPHMWPLSSKKPFLSINAWITHYFHYTRLCRVTALTRPRADHSHFIKCSCLYPSRRGTFQKHPRRGSDPRCVAKDNAAGLLKIKANAVAAIYINLSTSISMTYRKSKKQYHIILVNEIPSFRYSFLSTFIKYRKRYAQICNGNALWHKKVTYKVWKVDKSSYKVAKLATPIK